MHPRDLRPARAGELQGARIPADALSRTLAVIIPTLNEGEHIGRLLDDLTSQTLSCDVVVADGGSTDATVEIATSSGARVVVSPPGRAVQMNAGRAVVDAQWLLFLHADSLIEDPSLLERALMVIDDRQCGHFRLQFRSRDPRFRYLEAKTELSRPNTINGDQAMLVPAALFDALGGFDESLGFLEDQRFVRAARDRGVEWTTLPGELTTSARRFQRDGFGVRYFAMALIMSAWGAGAHELFDDYPDIYDLELSALIQALQKTTSEMSRERRTNVYRAAARFIRGEAWQLFFLGDVLLGDDETLLLDFYDAYLANMSLPWLDDLIAGAAYVLVNVVLSPDLAE